MKITLFDKINFDQLVQEKKQYLRGQILSYEDSYISSIIPNINEKIDELIDSCDLVDVPVFKNDERKVKIKNVLVENEALPPSGTHYTPGIPREVAEYNLPFRGNPQFFQCYLGSHRDKKPTIQVELNPDSLTFRLYPNKNKKITGNQEVEEELKKYFSKEKKIN